VQHRQQQTEKKTRAVNNSTSFIFLFFFLAHTCFFHIPRASTSATFMRNKKRFPIFIYIFLHSQYSYIRDNFLYLHFFVLRDFFSLLTTLCACLNARLLFFVPFEFFFHYFSTCFLFHIHIQCDALQANDMKIRH